MYLGSISQQHLDTAEFLKLPEAKYLVPMMVAVNDLLLHETTVVRVQTELTQHRYKQDIDANQMQLLEAELGLLNRHQFGLIWECLELLNEISNGAPTVVAYMTSFSELKTIYDLVLPHCKPGKLKRIRNNLSFHFGADFMEDALTTIEGNPTVVLKTATTTNYWYEVADEAQAHLLTRVISKIVNNQSTIESAIAKAEQQGLEMKALKGNLLSLFLSVIEHFIEPFYL